MAANRSTFRCRPRHGGFTLLELVTVMALIPILVAAGISGAALWVLPRLSRSAVENADRLNTWSALAAQFRADVASAAGLADQVGSYRAGAGTLILRLAAPAGTAGAATHLVWHWDGKQLHRVRWLGAESHATPLSGRHACESVAFRIEERAGTSLVAMTLVAPQDNRSWGRHPYEILAVVAADRH